MEKKNAILCFLFQYVKRLKAPLENIMEIDLSKGNKGKQKQMIGLYSNLFAWFV